MAISKKQEDTMKRAKELLTQLTLTEKIGQLSMFGTSIYDDKVDYHLDHFDGGRVGAYLTIGGSKTTNMLQKKVKEHFRIPIPLLFGEDVIHGYYTTMPTPLAQSCSWNPKAAKRGAEAAAKEAYTAGVRWTFSPMVDIARDPRWGRIVEGYGEDPYLCSHFSEAVVSGYQGNYLGEKYHILACMKHFVGYGHCVGGRDYNEVDMSQSMLRNVYLPSFQAGIDAGAATVMCGFHSLNGTPCSGNSYLLKDILRGECGFTGYVVSDAQSVHEMVPHGFAEDEKDAAYKGFSAGIQMLMAGDLYHDSLPQFIEEGIITEEDIDRAVLPILTYKFQLGLFEQPYVEEQEEEEYAFCEEHIQVSEKLARECIVLLENHGILPLEKDKNIALIGPLADDKEHVLGSWACKKNPAYTISILDGMKQAGMKVEYAKGCDISEGSEDDREQAKELARNSDVAVLVLGESSAMSGEARCRTSLELPKVQLQLLEDVLSVGTPVVLLISAGRPILVEPFRERVSALSYIWQLGTATGEAVADILTGVCDVSGRLSVSVPRSVGQIPLYYNRPNTGRPHTGNAWYELCYIDESVYPRYPFGYGLSYTSFAFTDMKLSDTSMSATGNIRISCKVTNTGKREGTTVAQLYVRDLVGQIVRPVKELKGFEKITLNAGESRMVSFELPAEQLAFYNETGEKIIEPGRFRAWIGEHSDDERLQTEFEIIE